jgi:hypothetical protein
MGIQHSTTKAPGQKLFAVADWNPELVIVNNLPVGSNKPIYLNDANSIYLMYSSEAGKVQLNYDLYMSGEGGKGVLTATRLITNSDVYFIDNKTTISKDESSNMTFKDAVTGTKTLAQLAATGITGSGANTRIGVWSGASTLGSDANFLWAGGVLTLGTVNGGGLVKLQATGSDPTAVASYGFLYTKLVSSQTELFFRSSDGDIVQLTPLAASAIVNASTEVVCTGDDFTFTNAFSLVGFSEN